jgi:hypothetical protein
MTTNVKIFKSTDTDAPVLSGLTGALITLLDAVLINGYNAKSVSALSRSGSTATATCVGHGYVVGDCLLVAGADQAEYNGEVYVDSVPDADTFTYAVDSGAVTPATGTITVKKAPAGWTKPYSGTNLAAYRMGGGNQRYLRLDDSGTGYNARVVGYEAMTGISTGTGPFPTSAQFSGGLYMPKSSLTTSAARDWVIAATDSIVFIHIVIDGLTTNSHAAFFGDFKSNKSGDQYNTLLLASIAAYLSGEQFPEVATLSSTVPGHYCARSYTQFGSSVGLGKHVDGAKGGGSSTDLGAGALVYPNPSDGGLYMSEVFLHEPSILRGTLPGIWAPLHAKPLTHGDTFTGAGDAAGREFLVLNLYNTGQIFLETSNTWNL